MYFDSFVEVDTTTLTPWKCQKRYWTSQNRKNLYKNYILDIVTADKRLPIEDSKC